MECAFCGKAFEEKKGHPAKFCSDACRRKAQDKSRRDARRVASERRNAEKRARGEALEAAKRPVIRDQCDVCKHKGKPLLCDACRNGFRINQKEVSHA